MSTFSRDDFIASMTKELERQVSITGDLAQVPSLGAAGVLRKLYYDFPEVSGSDILLLVAAMEETMNTPADFDRVRMPFTISRKLLENLAYLNDRQTATADPLLAEATGKLCAFIYLRLPIFLLNCDAGTLRGIFSRPALLEAEDGDGRGVADSKADLGAQLSWHEIWQEYAVFMESCSASVLCPAKGAAGDWFAELLKAPAYAASMETCVATLGALVTSFESSASENAQVSGSALHRRFFERREPASPGARPLTLLQSLREQVGRKGPREAAPAPEGGGGVESAADGQLRELRVSARRVWLHFTFVCRDVVAHCPALLQSWMPRILTAVAATTRTASVAADFPSEEEYLRVVICANISSALTSQQLQPAEQSADAAAAQARAALRALLDTNAANTLSDMVDICQRMRRGAADGGADAASFLLDISSLYVDGLDARGAGPLLPHLLASTHTKLIESRALAVLAELFSDAAAPDALPGLRSLLPRMLEVLAVAALQASSTASYVIRLPAMQRTLTTLWPQPPSAVHASVHPAELLPVLIGLLQAGDALARGGSQVTAPPSVVGGPSVEAVSKMLCELARETTRQVVAAVQAQSSAAADEADAVAAEEAERKDPEGESQVRRRKARAVHGLSRTLLLLTLPQTGGKTALQKLAASENKEDIAASLREMTIQSAKMSAADIKRNAKIAQSFLEGSVAHKMD